VHAHERPHRLLLLVAHCRHHHLGVLLRLDQPCVHSLLPRVKVRVRVGVKIRVEGSGEGQG
jgi:hypothetical protein